MVAIHYPVYDFVCQRFVILWRKYVQLATTTFAPPTLSLIMHAWCGDAKIAPTPNSVFYILQSAILTQDPDWWPAPLFRVNIISKNWPTGYVCAILREPHSSGPTALYKMNLYYKVPASLSGRVGFTRISGNSGFWHSSGQQQWADDSSHLTIFLYKVLNLHTSKIILSACCIMSVHVQTGAKYQEKIQFCHLFLMSSVKQKLTKDQIRSPSTEPHGRTCAGKSYSTSTIF